MRRSITNLMVGDWVNVDGKAGKIAFVSNTDFVNVEIDDTLSIETENPEPIPLTAELLEHNGFKKQEGGQWSLYKYENNDYTKRSLYHVLWSENEPYLEIASFTSETGEFNRMGIRYTHELQHALRLCGISENIRL